MPDAVTHPSSEELSAFGMGRLSGEAAAAVANHIKSCRTCRQVVAGVPAGKSSGSSLPPGPAPTLPEGVDRAKESAGHKPPEGLPPELANHPKYRFVRELGRGGMGVVYHAVQTLMDRPVAIKVINPEVLAHPNALPRFQAEAKAAAGLDHPNIIRADDADQVGKLHLLVMEFVAGTNLADLVSEKGPLSIAHSCHFVRQAALGLQHAFERGMVHRDIKPQNLMVTTRGVIRILDFGLARLRSERGIGAGLTQTGAFMGTPEYVSPEQATDARTADIRADLYSLGCTLYFLLTGRPPFQETTAVKTVLAQIEKEPPPLHELRPEVTTELAAVVGRLLAKDPARRYQTPIELAHALVPFIKSTEKSRIEGRQPSESSAKAPAKEAVEQSPESGKAEAAPAPAAGLEAPAFANLSGPVAGLDKPLARARAKSKPPLWYRRPRLIAAVSGSAVVLGVAVWLLAQVVFGGSGIAPDAKAQPMPAVVAPRPLLTSLSRLAISTQGSWRLDSEEAIQESRAKPAELFFGDSNWTDYDFTLEAMMTTVQPAWKNVLFRVEDTKNFWRICYGTYAHKMVLLHNQETNNFYRAVEPKLALIEPERWYRHRVEVRGSHIRCFLDDELIHDADKGKHPRGGVGIATWEANARYRKLKVADPDGKVLFEGLPDCIATAVAGRWRLDGSELVQESLDPDCRLLFGNPEWTDYDVTAEVRCMGGDGQLALCYRTENRDDFYAFGLGGGTNGGDRIEIVEQSIARPLHQHTEIARSNDQWLTMLVKVRGKQCQCLLDGKVLFDYENPRFSQGGVGVRTSAMAARFRNIRVTGPAGTVLWNGFPE
jgi:serine/threonine protein kinase